MDVLPGRENKTFLNIKGDRGRRVFHRFLPALPSKRARHAIDSKDDRRRWFYPLTDNAKAPALTDSLDGKT